MLKLTGWTAPRSSLSSSHIAPPRGGATMISSRRCIQCGTLGTRMPAQLRPCVPSSPRLLVTDSARAHSGQRVECHVSNFNKFILVTDVQAGGQGGTPRHCMARHPQSLRTSCMPTNHEYALHIGTTERKMRCARRTSSDSAPCWGRTAARQPSRCRRPAAPSSWARPP